MRTIYLDADFHCHIAHGDGLTAVETDFFDGMCDAFVQGYRFVPEGSVWVREDGEVFYGEMIAPWQDHGDLQHEQRKYERDRMHQAETILNELTGGVNDVHCE